MGAGEECVGGGEMVTGGWYREFAGGLVGVWSGGGAFGS